MRGNIPTYSNFSPTAHHAESFPWLFSGLLLMFHRSWMIPSPKPLSFWVLPLVRNQLIWHYTAPSGKTNIAMENRNFSWENSL